MQLPRRGPSQCRRHCCCLLCGKTGGAGEGECPLSQGAAAGPPGGPGLRGMDDLDTPTPALLAAHGTPAPQGREGQGGLSYLPGSWRGVSSSVCLCPLTSGPEPWGGCWTRRVSAASSEKDLSREVSSRSAGRELHPRPHPGHGGGGVARKQWAAASSGPSICAVALAWRAPNVAGGSSRLASDPMALGAGH